LSYYVYLEFGDKAKARAAKALPPLTSALDKDKWVEFPLKSVEHYNHNTAKFTFALPENTASLLPIAACVVVKPDDSGPKDAKGNPVVRPYTPISSSDRRGEIEFLIKKYDTGAVTPYIHNMKIGDKLSIKGPIPKFPYKSNEFDQVALIAGGSGITPMYQILDHALKLQDDKTKFKLIFANVTTADILLKEEFTALKKAHPDRFDVVYVIDKPEDGWTGATGYVDSNLIKEHVPPASLGEKVKVFVCGPPGQVNAISGKKEGMKQGALGGTLKELGYTESQVFKF